MSRSSLGNVTVPWQTLIAGAAAVLAAAVTILVLVVQIRQTGKLAAEQRRRRARAAALDEIRRRLAHRAHRMPWEVRRSRRSSERAARALVEPRAAACRRRAAACTGKTTGNCRGGPKNRALSLLNPFFFGDRPV